MAFSYLAVDQLSGDVLGFCLAEDFVDYLAAHFEVGETLHPVFALLDTLDQLYINQYGVMQRGEVFHLFMSGAATQVEGAAIVLALETKALEVARSLNYKVAVTTCTHAVTTYIAEELAFQRKYALPYASFEYKGQRVFASIAATNPEVVLFEKCLKTT